MEKYIENLIEQFKQATGARKIDINSQLFMSEFESWIMQRQLEGKDYLELLSYMEVFGFYKSTTAEIGKGRFDTIVKDFDTTIITPYSDGISVSEPQRIITAEFSVYKNAPLLIEKTENGTRLIESKNHIYPYTFMTQNPYTSEQIDNWDRLHNSCNGDIIIGVYGNVYDKDKESKIKLIEAFRNRLDESYKAKYVVDRDTYFYALASDRKIKCLVKTM